MLGLDDRNVIPRSSNAYGYNSKFTLNCVFFPPSNLLRSVCDCDFSAVGGLFVFDTAAPKGDAQLRYQAVLWQHHKFKSHLYDHRNEWKVLIFLFRQTVMVIFLPVWSEELICMKNQTAVNKSLLKIFLHSYSSKNLIIPLLMSFLCSLSPESQKTGPKALIISIIHVFLYFATIYILACISILNHILVSAVTETNV